MINFNEKTPFYGDKFKTRGGDIAVFIWMCPDGKYLMQLNNATFCWPVDANGRVAEVESCWDLIEQVEGQTLFTFQQQMDVNNSIYKDAMAKLLDQVGYINKDKRDNRREHIAIALIRAHGKYDKIEQDIDFIEQAILKDGK